MRMFQNIENYFVTGILHDIGKLLFIKNIEQEFADTLDYAARENVTIREAETAWWRLFLRRDRRCGTKQ
jgi:HD-like signal output (HDOD) protein